MRKLPAGSAPFLFAACQSLITCGLSAAISTHRVAPAGSFADLFVTNWAIAWATILPIVLLLAPLLRAAIGKLVRND